MTANDIIRLLVCLALLVCATLLIASMKPRLFSNSSRWLVGYVFVITMSAFLGVADGIGDPTTPIKWYGTPLRGLAAIMGLVYIWKTRPRKKGK